MHLSKAKWKEKKKINVAKGSDTEYSVVEYLHESDHLKIVDDKGKVKYLSRKEFMENYYELI